MIILTITKENTMSKTKQWAEDTATNQVDEILKSLKGGNIDEVIYWSLQ